MAYSIYTTDGIVLKKVSSGESNAIYYILTEKFGLIFASATASRTLKSKLKGPLQEYSLVSVSCVKGKNGWKLTSASDKQEFFFGYADYQRRVVAQIGSLLLKVVTGEMPHPEIFQIVRSGFEFLKSVKEEEIASFETLAVLRLLKELGYVSPNHQIEIFLKDNTEWSDSLLQAVSKDRVSLVGLINKAIKESHL